MAKSRLTPDYIEWVLKLNADEASREMHKLNEANKELSRQQNAARQAIVKLEAEGKKGSKEWQNLKRSVKEYGDQIKTNNEKLKELDKRLDVNQMSAAQLKKGPDNSGPPPVKCCRVACSSVTCPGCG